MNRPTNETVPTHHHCHHQKTYDISTSFIRISLRSLSPLFSSLPNCSSKQLMSAILLTETTSSPKHFWGTKGNKNSVGKTTLILLRFSQDNGNRCNDSNFSHSVCPSLLLLPRESSFCRKHSRCTTLASLRSCSVHNHSSIKAGLSVRARA